jgi:putative ABC transport system permease protein
MKNRGIGYEKEQLVSMPVQGELKKNYDSFKQRLLQNPRVLGVSASNIMPMHSNVTVVMEWEGKDSGGEFPIHMTGVDYDYIETFKMDMAEGRSFSRDFPTDETEAVILNETAVKKLGMESPLGKRFAGRTIIGIVKDYHFISLHKKIEPIFLFMGRRYLMHAFIRISPEGITGTLNDIKSIQKAVAPAFPFEFRFLDSELNSLYNAEKNISVMFSSFSAVAIFISCLGLFGMASFLAEQRTKEVGIRKILGASVTGVVVLLSKEFSKWVLAANVIAWPVAYLVMNRWLQNFAYRVSIDLWIFFTAAVLTFIISWFTVSYQSYKAATADPVKALRYE